jgi:hypothetical protein
MLQHEIGLKSLVGLEFGFLGTKLKLVCRICRLQMLAFSTKKTKNKTKQKD